MFLSFPCPVCVSATGNYISVQMVVISHTKEMHMFMIELQILVMIKDVWKYWCAITLVSTPTMVTSVKALSPTL